MPPHTPQCSRIGLSVHNFSFWTGAQALRHLAKIILADGAPISPRGQLTYELEDVTIAILHPEQSLCTGMNRKMNTSLAAIESLQLIGGFSDAELTCRVAPNMRNFLNEFGYFDGAYGPRVKYQMQPVIDKLRKDPNTRQAVVTIWKEDDLFNESKDYPCTLNFVFAIRNGKLCMKTHMRSNDIWWGWTYDVVQFTQLQLTVANVLGLEAGPYTHYVNSLHLYNRDVSDVLKLNNPPDAHFVPVLNGLGEKDQGWSEVQDRAQALPISGETEQWYEARMKRFV
jgi:thymidylate synthase